MLLLLPQLICGPVVGGKEADLLVDGLAGRSCPTDPLRVGE
jgi:hypothetical protein